MVPFAPRVRALTAAPRSAARSAFGGLSHADRALLTALAALCGWVVIATGLGHTPAVAALAYLASAMTLGSGLALGRTASRRIPPASFVGLLGLFTGLIVVGALATGGALSAPLGYANANAALAIQAIALAGVAALRYPASLGLPGLLVAGFAYAAVIANRSVAGGLLGGAVLIVVLLVRARPARRSGPALALGGFMVAISVGAGVWLARSTAWPGIVEGALSDRRRELWNEALALVTASPVAGHGAGSFRLLSSAAQDPDTQAAHSLVLQVGAEAGTVGMVLLMVIATVGFLVLRQGRPDMAVVGGAAWAAWWIHAQVDYVYAFPSVILTAGVVLGFASSPLTGSEQLDVAQSEPPLRGLGR